MWILMIYPSQALKISQTFEKKTQSWKRTAVGKGLVREVGKIEKLDSSFQLLDISNLSFQPHVRRLMRSLKKFEMRIDIPNAIRLNRKRFEANICARYLIWNKEVIIFFVRTKSTTCTDRKQNIERKHDEYVNPRLLTYPYNKWPMLNKLLKKVKRPGKYGNIFGTFRTLILTRANDDFYPT